eukprot:COSAG01_NODE_20774_length_936_cov_1.010753_2_plen_55_part_00
MMNISTDKSIEFLKEHFKLKDKQSAYIKKLRYTISEKLKLKQAINLEKTVQTLK